jgi:hypothetical protein
MLTDLVTTVLEKIIYLVIRLKSQSRKTWCLLKIENTFKFYLTFSKHNLLEWPIFRLNSQAVSLWTAVI